MTETANNLLHVTIPATSHSYPIYTGRGALNRAPQILRERLPEAKRLLIVSDEHVFPRYGAPLQNLLKQAGYDAHVQVLPAGEGSKTLASLEQIYQKAQQLGLSRKDAILALGGGVIGDLAGYAAASYMRGTGFVQIPTTLLAQVDSSVGGKTGVNYGPLKNALGAFYQPDVVIADPEPLNTLPEREWRAGLAEIVKYALLENTVNPEVAPQTLLETLEAEPLTSKSAHLPAVIQRCCALKAFVVAADERETQGTRALLNLGHTFAHAYEEITDYSYWRHGEAVAIGLIHACQLANRLGLLPQSDTERLMMLHIQLNLPFKADHDLPAEQLLALMRHDKKAHAGQIRFILPVERLGRAEIKANVPEEDVLAVLQRD